MKSRLNKHFLLVFLAAALWGLIGIFVDAAEKFKISEMQLVFGRAIITSAVIGVVILFKDRSLFKIHLKDIWLFILAGIISIILFNYAYFKTIHLSSFSVAAVLLYTAPFFVMFISAFLFKEKLTSKKLTSLLVAFIGCCFVTGVFSEGNRLSSTALVFGLLTGFGYGLYTIFSNLLLKRGYKTLTIIFYVFLFAGLFSIVFIDFGQTATLIFSDFGAFSVVFLMALFNSVIPYILYTAGLTGVEPSVAPIIAMVEPVVATIVGIFYNQKLTVFGAFGIVLVLSAVSILNIKNLNIKAYAKINLSLGILGKREDGYHLIDTVMQNISLYDRISISPSNKLQVISKNTEIAKEDNIVYKAAKLFFKETEIKSGAKIRLVKKIPYPAGLGGGSADAAAVLLGLDKLYNTNLSYNKLCEMALTLGADVPFFIRGGCQRAEGIGEVLTNIKPLKKGYFVLALVGQKPSTKEMYQKIDNMDLEIPNTEKIISAIENDNLFLLSENTVNSFLPIWEGNSIKSRLLKSDALSVSLSGSGPTFFALFENKKQAKALFKELKKENINAYLVKPVGVGVEIE